MNIIAQLSDAANLLKHDFPFILQWVGIAWAIQLVNVISGNKLQIFGILPRHILGVPGIFLSPFIHGDWNHLFMNSLFFIAMGCMLILHGKKAFYIVSISVIIISGIMVWFLGRKAWHVGASSLVMGYWSFLTTKAYFEPDLIDLISAGLGVYYCGIHLTASLLANGPGVSEEGHISGFIAGIITAIYFAPIKYYLNTFVTQLL